MEPKIGQKLLSICQAELENKYKFFFFSIFNFVLKNKQCRERWHNHLNPNIKKERWTEAEDLAIIEAHKILKKNIYTYIIYDNNK